MLYISKSLFYSFILMPHFLETFFFSFLNVIIQESYSTTYLLHTNTQTPKNFFPLFPSDQMCRGVVTECCAELKLFKVQHSVRAPYVRSCAVCSSVQHKSNLPLDNTQKRIDLEAEHSIRHMQYYSRLRIDEASHQLTKKR